MLKQKDNKKSAVHGHCLLSYTGWFNKDNNTSKSTLENKHFKGNETFYKTKQKHTCVVVYYLAIIALLYLVYLWFQHNLRFYVVYKDIPILTLRGCHCTLCMYIMTMNAFAAACCRTLHIFETNCKFWMLIEPCYLSYYNPITKRFVVGL